MCPNRRYDKYIPSVHPNVERVQATLERLGSRARVAELQQSTRTSAEAASAVGTTVAQIAKSIVFTKDGEGVLVIASGDNRVSEHKVSALLGSRIRRAGADEVRRLTGYPIGGVAPVAHATRLRILIDRDLLDHSEIWAAAGTPNAVFRTTPPELVRISGGAPADVKQE